LVSTTLQKDITLVDLFHLSLGTKLAVAGIDITANRPNVGRYVRFKVLQVHTSDLGVKQMVQRAFFEGILDSLQGWGARHTSMKSLHNDYKECIPYYYYMEPFYHPQN
jgi:hypothetical protein